MKIRKATLKDYEQMSKLYKQVDKLHSDAHPNVFQELDYDARTLEYIESIISNEDSLLLVAEEDNLILGLAKADIETNPSVPLFIDRKWINISTIVVDKTHRGKGIGRLLLEEIYSFAKQHHIKDIELTVYSFNEDALTFYELNEFTEIRKKLHKKL